jgi:hypothetical protein
MDAQNIQAIVVAAAALCMGLALLALSDDAIPEGLMRDWAKRLGRGRRLMGLLIVLVAKSLLIGSFIS